MNKPNPGSSEAVAQGCKCPVMDNFHGKGIPFTSDEGEILIAFWKDATCPLHGLPELIEKDSSKEG